jgi:hypothetical protein
MRRSQGFCIVLNALWKPWSQTVFSTACYWASITSVVSKCVSSIKETDKSRKETSQANKEDGGRQSCWFWSNIPWWRRLCETVCCCDATARPFVTMKNSVFWVVMQCGVRDLYAACVGC